MTVSEGIRRRIVWWLRHVWRGRWSSIEALAQAAGLSRHQVKRELRRLVRARVLELRPMYDARGLLSGRGYFLTDGWRSHEPGRPEDPAPGELEAEPGA